MTVIQEPELPQRMLGLPRDRRGFIVPAEAGWDDDGPHLAGIGQAQNFALALVRACAVCGFPLKPGEPVYRLFTQAEAADRRINTSSNYESANPGHLVCMLYSSQVCPFWSRAEARLGKDSTTAPGQRRGKLAALLGYDDYELLLPQGRRIGSASMLYGQLIEDHRFRSPEELSSLYETERLADVMPQGQRAYWTNDPTEEHALLQLTTRGLETIKRTRPAKSAATPDGQHWVSYKIPLLTLDDARTKEAQRL